MKKKNFLKALSFALLAVVLSSCGIWTDFTTYFNTYYNAKTLFDRVEEEIIKRKKDIFAFREDQSSAPQFTGQFPSQPTTRFIGETGGQSTTQFSGNINQDLNKVIEKCSKILQYQKESSFFPDALFITGKAFYYLQEYSRAQRKFLELAVLGDNKYALENNLWLAKTYLQLRSFNEGLKLLEEVKAEALKEGNDKLIIETSITKISFFIFREEYIKAIEACKDFLETSDDEEKSALVTYQMGKIYLKINDKENALRAFNSVLKYSPAFEIELQSRLETARLLKALNRVDESEKALEEMQHMGKFKNNLDEIYIELGQIYYDKKETKRAIDFFKDVDSTYRVNPASGIASFWLGKVYEEQVRDYDSSYKYYNKAAMSLAPREIKQDAGKKARDIDKYFIAKNDLKELDKKLTYVIKPHIFEADSVEYDIALKEYLEDNRRLMEQQSRGFSREQSELGQQQLQPQKDQKDIKPKQIPLKTLIAQGKIKKPERPRISADSIKTEYAQSLYTLGSLFFSELDALDSAYFYFQKILNEYPDKPVKAQTLYSLGTYYEIIKDTSRADSIFKFIYDNYEKEPLRNAAAQKLGLVKKEEKKIIRKDADPAEKFYVEVEQLYYDKKYEAAIDSFKNIYKNFRTSLFAPKALFYAGFIYENELKMYDSAAVYYGILISEFKETPTAKAVFAKYMEFINQKLKTKEAEKEPKEAEKKKNEEQIQIKDLPNQQNNPVVNPITIQPEVADTLDDNVKKFDPKAKKISTEPVKTERDTSKKPIKKPE